MLDNIKLRLNAAWVWLTTTRVGGFQVWWIVAAALLVGLALSTCRPTAPPTALAPPPPPAMPLVAPKAPIVAPKAAPRPQAKRVAKKPAVRRPQPPVKAKPPACTIPIICKEWHA